MGARRALTNEPDPFLPLMRLDRGTHGDRAATLVLLERGSALGDARSREWLYVERVRFPER